MTSKTLKVTVAALALAMSAAAGAATRTSTPPSRLFDLSHFRLTLPISSSGKTTDAAMTLDPWQLTASPGYASQYFFTDTDAAMVFNAPSNGATTTPGSGSDHTRSELREVYRLPSPTEWTNKIGGTMTASCRVNKIAAKSTSTVIGQIHGLSAEMLILRYNSVKKTIEAKPYAKPNGTPSYLTLASNVAIGTKINYSIQYIGSSMSITVNGKVVNLTVDPAWNGVPVYFKAGAYSDAPASGNAAGDATEVAFYSIYIQH